MNLIDALYEQNPIDSQTAEISPHAGYSRTANLGMGGMAQIGEALFDAGRRGGEGNFWGGMGQAIKGLGTQPGQPAPQVMNTGGGIIGAKGTGIQVDEIQSKRPDYQFRQNQSNKEMIDNGILGNIATGKFSKMFGML